VVGVSVSLRTEFEPGYTPAQKAVKSESGRGLLRVMSETIKVKKNQLTGGRKYLVVSNISIFKTMTDSRVPIEDRN